MFQAPSFLHMYTLYVGDCLEENSAHQEMCDLGAAVYGLELFTPRGTFRYVYDNNANMIFICYWQILLCSEFDCSSTFLALYKFCE